MGEKQLQILRYALDDSAVFIECRYGALWMTVGFDLKFSPIDQPPHGRRPVRRGPRVAEDPGRADPEGPPMGHTVVALGAAVGLCEV